MQNVFFIKRNKNKIKIKIRKAFYLNMHKISTEYIITDSSEYIEEES